MVPLLSCHLCFTLNKSYSSNLSYGSGICSAHTPIPTLMASAPARALSSLPLASSFASRAPVLLFSAYPSLPQQALQCLC